MAKVFLDTNFLIDALHRKPERQIVDSLENHIAYVSALSFHIYCYVFNIKIPNEKISRIKEKFQIVDFSEDVLTKSLQGPTSDFEDNIQLHSAAESDCTLFFTSDKSLLRLKSFGEILITQP